MDQAVQPFGQCFAILCNLLAHEGGEAVCVDRLIHQVAVAPGFQSRIQFILAVCRSGRPGLVREGKHRPRPCEVLRFRVGHDGDKLLLHLVSGGCYILCPLLRLLLLIAERFEPLSQFVHHVCNFHSENPPH